MKTLFISFMALVSIALFSQDVKEMKSDTTKVKIGNSTIIIISPNSKNYEIVTENEQDEKFKGHWGGLDIGLNGYLNKDNSTALSTEDSYLELDVAKSWGIGINLIEKNIGIVGENFGLVTGLGLEINNYRFKNSNYFVPDSTIVFAYESDIKFEKSKIVATYLTLPLLLEYQIPVGKKDNKFHIAAGAIGSLRIGSHTKYVYEIDGVRHKDKNRDDYFLSPLRYSATVRVGFNGLKLFANYNLSTLFEKNRGPELYPFTVGISIIGF